MTLFWLALAPCVLAAVGSATRAAPAATKTVLFLGDSLTAGYGLSKEQAYPALVQVKIDAAGLPWKAVNGGVSGDTSAGGLRRVNWLLKRPVDVLVVALGANDGLRGIDLKTTRKNLQGIIDRARAKNPGLKVVVAGMRMPPNLGPDYTEEFRRLFPGLAEANGAALIPFLLEKVAADPELNLPDGIHPNARGQQVLAETVWRHLEPVLRGGDGVDPAADPATDPAVGARDD